MDAEVILHFYGATDAYNQRNEDIDSTLTELNKSYDIETQNNTLMAQYVGAVGREVILRGSQEDLLEATGYLVTEMKDNGHPLPANRIIDPFHPIAAYKGFRLSSYVLAKEEGLTGHLDVAYADKEAEAKMEDLSAYATELAEKHGITAKVEERIKIYPVAAPVPVVVPSEVTGFYFSLDGDVNGIEGATRELREKFEDKPDYFGDILHPIRSFRGKNVARVIELEREE